MADKDLHDIKIDELDSPKKTPLKNILTLLALLLIIFVISVVITQLILDTDKDTAIENNDSKSELISDIIDSNDSNKTDSDTKDKEDESNTNVAPILNSNIPERNLTSAIKPELTSHEPTKLRTYKDPKKNDTAKEVKKVPKKTETVTRTTRPAKTTVSQRNVTPAKTTVSQRNVTPAKKEYIDKVVVKKNSTSSSQNASTKSASFLGGKRKDVTDSYYIKVGTYRDISTILNKIKKNNFNYSIVKVENDKTLMRVLVGPFFSRNQANTQLAKVKANILAGAYVTKAK